MQARLLLALGVFLSPCLDYSTADGQQLPPVSDVSGRGNNERHPEWGTPGQQLLRRSRADYADRISSPAGANRPSARLVTNMVSAEVLPTLDERNLSDWAYGWGQFIDHDMDLTGAAAPVEEFDISVPQGDPSFDPKGTGTQVIPLQRSLYDTTTGTSTTNPRQQIDQVTAFIDGSMVYGSDQARADALRTMQGGKLKSSPGNFLPLNSTMYFTTPLENANDAHVVPDGQLFAAGDVRANENIELLAIQTLFMREHNRLADAIAKRQPELSDEQIFQYARAIVRAEIQSITYNEWLPALLGSGRMPPYHGYNPIVNPGINTEFSTAALRLGHSMLQDDIQFLDNNANQVHAPVELRDAFFNPAPVQAAGIDPILKYLATDNSRRIDTKVVDDVRNFLFGPPGAGGFDLAARNIQRGRDHGLPDYNLVRAAYTLRKLDSVRQITKNRDMQNHLRQLYGTPDNMDVWVGGLAEDHPMDSSVGALFTVILSDQFRRLRDGDRFWFENVFSGRMLETLRHTRLSDVIKRNTKITNLQENVFFFDVSISGKVYLDTNGDGKEDHGESDAPGVSLSLLVDGQQIDTTQTTRIGSYLFHNIHEPGAYQVRVNPAAGSVTSQNPVSVQITRGGGVTRVNFGVTAVPVSGTTPPPTLTPERTKPTGP